MADRCPRCGSPLCIASTEAVWDIETDALAATVACRDRELAHTKAALAATETVLERARALLIKSRDALDLAISVTQGPAGGPE